MKTPVRYYLESLGCPKNLVDSHGMARQLKRLGHQPVGDPHQAQVLIVNTCGFIEDAREESISELRELAAAKRPDQVLVAAGCLSQRRGPLLAEEIPGLDAVLGTRRWAEIEALLKELARTRGGRPARPLAMLDDPVFGAGPDSQRYARQGATAYLKIADGCSAPCAFCAIPLIKGRAVSRPAASIVQDAVELVQEGVQELVFIAQDTTAYGLDQGERDALPGLVQDILDAVPSIPSEHGTSLPWLRLMYAYPGHVSARLIEVMASDPRVCHYLDLPLQHAHPAVLRRMRRPSNVERVHRLIESLRHAIPDLALRTSFIVGYPGESEAEFSELLAFVREVRPDRVGVFCYSPEEGTPAATLPEAVPDEIKVERQDRLMALQQEISLELNEAQVGRALDVLVEGTGDGLSAGRSYRDAPEIDGLVLFPGHATAGEVVPVRITQAIEYDLMGVAIQPGER